MLVGGWPASGKTTLAHGLADELRLPRLSKDDVKEALIDALGTPATVAESRRLGTAAVHAVLRVARGMPGAVVDSTWFGYSRPLVEQLPGPKVEVRCLADHEVVRARFAARHRGPGHLDERRTDDELWAEPVEPLGVGPLVDVDTNGPVDVQAVARRIRFVSGG